jgi:hypothetical protein
MWDRLKSLPLTIALTVLIWIYAEAQFTSVREDVRVNVRVLSPAAEVAVRVFDSAENRYTPMLNVRVTLQGPKSELEKLYQESLATGPEDDVSGLTYQLTGADMQRASERGGNVMLDCVSMLNRLDYFRSRGVTVTVASPARASVEVDRMTRLTKPVEFRPSQGVDRFTLAPDTVDVWVPSGTLAGIGGADKLTVVAEPLKDLSTLPADSEQVIAVRYRPEYPGGRDDRIRLSQAQGQATVHVPRRQQQAVQLGDIPIWVSGPPAALSRYDVDVQPKTVAVAVTGSAAPVDALRGRIARNGTAAAGVYAYLDITPDDRPGDTVARRRLRYVLPDGLTLLSGPADVAYRLIERTPPPATPPSPPAPAAGARE